MPKEAFVTKDEIQAIVRATYHSASLQYIGIFGECFQYASFLKTLKPAAITDFLAMLQRFDGKAVILLVAWLRHLHALLDSENKIKLTLLTVDKKNPNIMDFPKNGLVSLEIDLTQLDIADLRSFLDTVKNWYFHSITFKGETQLAENDLSNFLEQFYKVDFFHFENTFSNYKQLQEIADQISYRNHLIRQLGLNFKTDVWKLMVEKWVTFINWRAETSINLLSYLKPFADHLSQPVYCEYLKALYGLRAEKGAERYYDPSKRDDWGSNFELYATLNACITGMGDLFFEKMLEHLSSQLQLHSSQRDVDLAFNLQLTDASLSKLAEYIRKHQHSLPFAKLSLYVTRALIQEKGFLNLISALQGSSIQGLTLGFPCKELEDSESAQTVTYLLKTGANNADYPVVVAIGGQIYRLRFHENNLTPTVFQAFENKIIDNIRIKNQGRFFNSDEASPAKQDNAVPDRQHSQANAFARKIKLKELINPNAKPENYDNYIKLEIQHTEVVAQQEIQKIEEVQKVELEVEVEVEIEQQGCKTYSGEILDSRELGTQPYYGIALGIPGVYLGNAYSLIQKECFGNLPNAIQFLSPEAAIEMSKNLPSFATLNADNLPKGFSRKTMAERWVLDFDPYEEERQENIFTPKALNRHEEREPIYPRSLDKDSVRKWINNNALYNAIQTLDNKTYEEFHFKKLVNLWIRFGNEGTRLFFKKLNEVDVKHSGFSLFLFENYLQYFLHWDHFLEDENFLKILEKITNYDSVKLACLKRFLLGTGESKHDLKQTVDAFEFFWSELEVMCQKKNADIKKIDTKWSITFGMDRHKHNNLIPLGGNPVVYMERLLKILKNARDLNEQLDCLDGLMLDNYGAYYASRYEGFRVVSSEMHFNYDPDIQNRIPFNPDAHRYRVELEEIYNKANSNMDPSNFYCLVYRFLGEQPHSIHIKIAIEAIKNFSKNFNNVDSPLKIVLTALFFVSHQRYRGEIPLYNLLAKIKNSHIDREVMDETNQAFMQFYKQGIRLDEVEGDAILTQIAKINASSVLKQSKKEAIKRFFKHLQKNRYGVLKCLRKLSNAHSHAIIYTLNIADYFAKDLTIASVYGDDLFVFSTLISGKLSLITYEDNDDIRDQLEAVTQYLIKASDTKTGRNLDYAFKRLVQSNEYFSFETCLAAFEKIQKIEKFDPNAVTTILTQHQLKITLDLPEVFSREDADLKNILILFICGLKTFGQDKTHVEMQDVPEAVSEEEQQQLSQEQEKLEKDKKDFYQRTLQINSKEKISDELALELSQIEKELSEKSQALTLTAQRLKERQEKFIVWQKNTEILSKCSIQELQHEFQEEWKKISLLSFALDKFFLKPSLLVLGKRFIAREFNQLGDSPFVKNLMGKIENIRDFSGCDSFEKIDNVITQASTLAELFSQIMTTKFFEANQAEFSKTFCQIDYARFDYEALFLILSLLTKMPQRNYLGILKQLASSNFIFENKEKLVELTGFIERLHLAAFPSDYIETVVKWFNANQDSTQFSQFITQIIQLFEANKDDELLKFLIDNPSVEFSNAVKIVTITQEIKNRRDTLRDLFKAISSQGGTHLKDFLEKISTPPSINQVKIITIIAKSNAVTSKENLDARPIIYAGLFSEIAKLDDSVLDDLSKSCETSAPTLHCLQDALLIQNSSESIPEGFLQQLETMPFGKRDFKEQFDCSQVERVINGIKDLNNRSKYTYQYRKKMMEAFLFVNQIGYDLPVYRGKAAKDLSNQEIRELFQSIKFNKTLAPFQKRLYALGLMREAMHRTTGKFPYSTQIIAIIDCMMHEGDVIAEIDTGQGKGLIDVMKAALLWIDSDSVSVTTSSLVDAKRDIRIYSRFLKLLNIPHSETPITATSEFKAYQTDGINYSTFSQLSLFFSKAEAEDVAIGNETDVASLVPNESDHAILDDKIIYRYASSTGTKVGLGDEWIYTAINEFIDSQNFKACNTSQEEDIAALREYLTQQAKMRKKPSYFVDKFDDEQLLMWIESALFVAYRLHEKFDYGIPEKSETKVIYGVSQPTRVINVLAKDGKVSPETQYGNAMQQLLYARLNKKAGKEVFVIEPESKTIISSNNKNLVTRYRRSKQGFIWGSSATVGSQPEIKEQYKKYGFSLSKIPPHQPKIVKPHKPVVLENEAAHFNAITQQILKKTRSKNGKIPHLVFFKDIETAERFFAHFKTNTTTHADAIQLYTGIGNEEQIIFDAAKPGMITVTTSALGRNTDILYDRELGMNEYQTFVDSPRGTEQKAGRTGRQGSPGEIYYIFNRKDLKGRSVETIQAEIEAQSVREREFNEELYDLLGYFLAKIHSLKRDDFREGKATFVKKHWAKFSADIEAKYRESTLNECYQKAEFIEQAVVSFNTLLSQAIQEDKLFHLTSEEVTAHLDKRYEASNQYDIYQKDVKISDCISPDIIAYHILDANTLPDDSIDENSIKITVKRKLEVLFDGVEKGEFYSCNKDYISYINSNPTHLSIVRKAHAEFLSDFLQKKVEGFQNRWFIERWLGTGNHVNNITNDKNYLLIFKALMEVQGRQPESVISIDQIKVVLTTLVDEYLQNSWFINANRRKAAEELKEKIRGAEEWPGLFAALSNSKIEAIKKDISSNKNSIVRYVKPISFFGNSRFQNTLDNALSLTSALAGHNTATTTATITALSEELKTVTQDITKLNGFLANPKIDNFKLTAEKLAFHDKGNAKVLIKSLDNALSMDMLYSPSCGMSGRS